MTDRDGVNAELIVVTTFVGAAIGLAIGLVDGHPSQWLTIGLAFGFVVGAGLNRRRSR